METLISDQQPEKEQTEQATQQLSALQQEVTAVTPQDPEQPTYQCKTWEEYNRLKELYAREMKLYETQKRLYEHQFELAIVDFQASKEEFLKVVRSYGVEDPDIVVKNDSVQLMNRGQILESFTVPPDYYTAIPEQINPTELQQWTSNILLADNVPDRVEIQEMNRDLGIYKLKILGFWDDKSRFEKKLGERKNNEPMSYQIRSEISMYVAPKASMHAENVLSSLTIRESLAEIKLTHPLRNSILNKSSELVTDDTDYHRYNLDLQRSVFLEAFIYYYAAQHGKKNMYYTAPILPTKPLPPKELAPIGLNTREQIRGYYQEMPTRVVFNPTYDEMTTYAYDITLAGTQITFVKDLDDTIPNLGGDIMLLQRNFPSWKEGDGNISEFYGNMAGKDLNKKLGRNVHSSFPDAKESYPSHMQLGSLELVGTSGINSTSGTHNGLVRLYKVVHKASGKAGYMVMYEPHQDKGGEQPLSCFALDPNKTMTSEEKSLLELFGDIFVQQSVAAKGKKKIRQINPEYVLGGSKSRKDAAVYDPNMSGSTLNQALDQLLGTLE